MTAVATTRDQRRSGVWGVRHSVARKTHWCFDCGHAILTGQPYWRQYGKMAESVSPFMAKMCDTCHSRWSGEL